VTAEEWEWPPALAASPELQVAMQDIDEWTLDEPPSVERAAELNSEGLRIRLTDFEQARSNFLSAARMTHDLLRRGEPRVGLADLEWYLASYCAATAGSRFFRNEYAEALKYYLAFFALAQETEPVWERVHNLLRPMLSYYQTIAANENRERLAVSPGQTQPARIAVVLNTHKNPKVQERWLELARRLAQVNPAALWTVVQALELMDTTEMTPGVQETRTTLADLLADAGSDNQACTSADEPGPGT
jgi:hypothetical protein